MSNDQTYNICIDSNTGETKLQQLTNALLSLINTSYSEGDVLPSVNVLSKKLQVSRDTVFKAYSELKRRKIVDSTPTKGYFVNRDIKKVLLILDFYSPFKDIVYREIENNLDETYSIDLVFHHYNEHLFESVILESAGRYNVYIVMNIDTKNLTISNILKKIDPAKLLLLDIPINKWKDFQKEKYNYVWQNFDEAVYTSLSKIRNRINKYSSFHIIIPDHLQHPIITLHAFNKFCEENKIPGFVINSSKDIDVSDNEAYFILRQRDLYTVLSQCKDKKYKVGKNVGILAYNDSPLYEFVSNGITVISTDFKEMGKKASQFIKNGINIKETIQTRIILRKSL